MVMDPIKHHQEAQCITKAREAMPLGGALLPLSILSFFLLSYYCCTTSLLHSLHQFISRKTMFLLGNAILLFIAGDSGLLRLSVSSDDPHDEFIPRRGDRPPTARSTPPAAAADIQSLVGSEEKGGVETVGCLELVVVGGDEGEKMGVDESGVVGVEEMEDLGVDELYKRCEEFIERVKRERRLEGCVQLAMV